MSSLQGVATPHSTFLPPPSGPANCSLVKSFFTRQGIIAIAALIFLVWTAVRVRLGREKRDLKTFIADVSKQGGQQMMGGVMMVLLGLHLSEGGLSPLAWYGAQYPFEIVLTTTFTGFLRKWIERTARDWQLRTRWDWLAPYALVGQYGPNPGDFRCSWYAHQFVQAILLIGLPARVVSLGLIMGSLTLLPAALSPVSLLARAWYFSGLTCDQQTVFILYLIPLSGDALQFIIIDKLQAFGGFPQRSAFPVDSDTDDPGAGSTQLAGRKLLSSSTSTGPAANELR
eukprot:CAMPEP_0181212394 /NCGR_PEP_ID=MMETSP1096-20121128/24326_1 /TAXON_ID=156174 ORGANISM="Chrysochromulina ericina, Strain CCMP281" /NCGR_SAMPLE_ID=MMETSP1096 /ASSEMBLY_ACC=CAM_ASM_000453 /LENGTH=284 /DNA_ID=CAMNT_0023303919 /DNA_START=8 /DNA_END=862 /DNA_ORIENTATION=+